MLWRGKYFHGTILLTEKDAPTNEESGSNENSPLSTFAKGAPGMDDEFPISFLRTRLR